MSRVNKIIMFSIFNIFLLFIGVGCDVQSDGGGRSSGYSDTKLTNCRGTIVTEYEYNSLRQVVGTKTTCVE